MPTCKIVLIEPFMADSHQQWALDLQKFSRHEIHILSLPGRHWKWRMHGAAVTLARSFLDLPFQADLILATDMLDLTTFLALTRNRTATTPVGLYFHENQLTYPWSPDDPDPALSRNHQYAFINYTSALAADAVLFNSNYHRQSFLKALPVFLKKFPDYQNLQTIDGIEQKSHTLHLALDLKSLNQMPPDREGPPTILWNHRWEYDKNPQLFFDTLAQLQKEKIHFRLLLLGKSYSRQPEVFTKAKAKFQKELLHYGYVESRKAYINWLWFADILPVSSRQDFFGISVAEAIFCNCFPILPNRLAYPEHIPESRWNQHLYNDPKHFYELLKHAITNIDTVRHTPFQPYVSHYDWQSAITEYDQLFEKLIYENKKE